MLSNILKFSLRNILRHRSYSALNITGFSLGILACLLMGLFVYDEYQFDKQVPHGDRIFRAYYTIKSEEGNTIAATTPPTFATTLKQDFPEVAQTLRVFSFKSKLLFGYGAIKTYEEGAVLSDPNFSRFFPMEMVEGAAVDNLTGTTSVLISDALAQKLFGRESALQKNVIIGKNPYTVTGVFKKDPHFHLDVNCILPIASQKIPEDRMGDWGWYGFYNYVLLKPGANATALEKKYQAFVDPFVNKPGADRQFTPHFQSLPAIHLYSTAFEYDMAVKGNITYVRVLMVIIAFILLIASFNFVNLAIARALQRAKEVGVRKSIGASRTQLITQFLTETFILTLVSAGIAFAATCVLLPVLNHFTGKQIGYAVLFSIPSLLLLLLLVVVISVIAGIYPAFVLSGFKPTSVLKGLMDGTATKKVFIRQGLVVVQFVLSVLMIIAAIVVIRQVNYMHNKELGFKKEQLLLFSIPGKALEENADAVRQELLQSPNITNVSAGYGFPGDMYGDGMLTLVKNGTTKKTNLFMVDEDYLKTVGLQLAAGRDFSRAFSLDKNNFIINETAAKEFGFTTPQQAIGQTLTWPTWRKADSIKRGQIVGVVKDFHYKSMHDKIEPLTMQNYPPAFAKMAVRIKTDNIPEALEQLKKVYAKFSPDYPLVYNFLDESFEKMYGSEDKLKTLISLFTGITLFIASLGLLGLAAYAAERRRKELGIRKVLGASGRLLILLVSQEFLVLVSIAFVIASPIAYYFMNQWLQDFAYRVTVSWWIFLMAGGLTLVVAFVTVVSQIVKVTYANPVRNLRVE